MAFLDGRNKERFSLLLLEPGEIYFKDFHVIHFPEKLNPKDALKKSQGGRLKICSKSIVFDPEDAHSAIIKLPLQDCEVIEKWMGSSPTSSSNPTIHIRCNQFISMLEGNVIAPYTFRRESRSFLFTITYLSMDNCLPLMCQLQRAATLSAADQSSMVALIVLSNQSRVSFSATGLEDLHEKIICESMGNHITPLVTNPGRIVLTNSRLYFQPFNNAEPWILLKLKLSEITRIIKRRFLLRHVGLELYCSTDASVEHLFLSFKNKDERDSLFDQMMAQEELKLDDSGQENMMLLWQNGVISNYDYLLYLNSLADRSFNDLTQYPVFPWVLSDFTSKMIDLSNPLVYRDLSKPVGALNHDRLKKLLDRYKEMAQPKFLYGSHYSTPGFVLYYLVRQMPQYMLCLQNGRFDHPDRMFNSVQDTWRNVTVNTSDFKELIPQFYDPSNKGSFLGNTMGLDFGVRHNGKKVGNVELPPWAKDPEDFINKLRTALESPQVSKTLHSWIDLIFGYKQRGPEAEKAHNVYYYLTYEGSIDLDSIKDFNERYSLEVQIMEFGQIPKQIFQQPHPQRRLPSPAMELAFSNYDRISSKEHPFSNDKMEQDFLNCSKKHSDEKYQRCNPGHTSSRKVKWERNLSRLTLLVEYKMHKEEVTDVSISENRKIVYSVSKDSLLKMYSVENQKQLRSVSISNMALSSCFLLPGDHKMFVGSWDNYVYLYNMEFGKVLGSIMAHDDAVIAISWNNSLLATASWDSTAKLWKCPTSEPSRAYNSADLLAELEHETGVRCVSLNPSNSLLATGTNEGQINFWSLSSYALHSQLLAHTGAVEAVSFSPDEQKVISCSKDQSVKVHDVTTGSLLFSKTVAEELGCLSWDGMTALTGGVKGNLYVWDLHTAQQTLCLSTHSGPVTCIAVANDGSLVATGGKDGKVIVWCAGMQ